MPAKRLLIIDDEPHLREVMRLALETQGYEVVTAADGPGGLERFGTGAAWDLVLLDQRMPGMDGLDVLRELRARDPQARVVMATAYGTIELAVDAMKAGALDFLRKPFTPEVLRGAVRAALLQPREAPPTEDLSLSRLLPQGFQAPRLPLIYFRTLNGYAFWPVDLPVEEEETEALRIRRMFDVRAPSGEARRCAVDVTTSVRALIRTSTQQEHPPQHALWDLVCKSALSHYLWEKAEFPPDNLLVYGLTPEQLQAVRSMAGLGPSRI
jgi:DNA-binding response OmpR family regulator